VATPVTFTSLNQVKRSRIQTLEQGFIVTALSADGDYRLATIVEDHGDEGYMLVFSDGEQKLLRQPREGFLPDVFFPGAQVSAPGQPAQGRIVRRQGQAVLVEFLADQQRWYPAALLSLAPWAKVPPPGVAARLDMTLSRWSSGTTYYPALELERQGGKLLVIYLDEGTVELREPSDLSPLPRPGSRVQFEPAEGRIEVATVVNFLNEIAVQLRFENGEELWVETTRITRK
jgi:hypothetical protein